jgi:AraC-like DNA-binding protein
MPSTLQDAIARRIRGVVAERAPDALPCWLPICLRSANHVHLAAGKFEMPKKHRMFMAAWLISGKATAALGARRLNMIPGDLAIFLPSTSSRFWIEEDDNELCFITADGPMSDELALHLGINTGVYNEVPAPMPRIYQLVEAVKDGSVAGQRKASLMTIEAMYDLADSIQQKPLDQVVRRSQQMIQQDFSDPELSTESIAAELNYHRGSLSRIFHKQTGMTIIDYIMFIRLQQAKALLQHTDEKVAWIAEKCGFRESAYFCRWLRIKTGQTARELRHAGPGKNGD